MPMDRCLHGGTRYRHTVVRRVVGVFGVPVMQHGADKVAIALSEDPAEAGLEYGAFAGEIIGFEQVFEPV